VRAYDRSICVLEPTYVARLQLYWRLASARVPGSRPVPGLDVRGELLQLQLFMTLATILKAAEVLFRGTSILEYKFVPDYNSVTHF